MLWYAPLEGDGIGEARPLQECGEFSVNADFENCMASPLVGEYSIPFSAKSKYCKSRKRFVKLLMGRGWSRNAANACAKRQREIGISYSFAWWLHCFS